ncbi:MAG: carbohydrate ABC transporter permease [Ruminiclostridium sp.]|nr:carbohydrate ABC transporter permease [Ruminiclostridium sp.]
MDNENIQTVQEAASVQKKAKSKRQLKKEEKERLSKFHVSSWEIITHYFKYTDAEKKHYKYILGRRVGEKVWPVFRFLILFGLAFVVVYPILYMISCAVRPQTEMSDPSIMWIPKTFTWSNLEETWVAIDYPKLVWDTVTVNVVCSIIQVLTCSIVGYGFARFKFKGKGFMFAIVIMQIIVPTQVILIPQYMQFRYFDPLGICSLITGAPINLADSPMALYMMAFFCNGIRAGLFIFLFRQFFRGLPKELEDAAYLDGCGPFETFVRIMVPNASNSFLTVFIFSVVWYWNDSYVSGMFFTKSNTVALMVSNLYQTISAYYSPTGTPTGIASDWLVWIESGCLLSILPILVMYIFLQKNFVEGIERSGIVG